MEVVVGEKAEGGGEVGGACDLGSTAAVLIVAGEAIQSGKLMRELLRWGEGGLGLRLDSLQCESKGADLEIAEVVVGNAGSGLLGKTAGGGCGLQAREGGWWWGGCERCACVMAGVAAVLEEEFLSEISRLWRESEDLALAEGGRETAGVEVSGDVCCLTGAEVLRGHATGGPGGEGIDEEGRESGKRVVVSEGDGRGGEGRGFEIGFGREAGGAVVGAGFVAGDAAEGMVEGFPPFGIAGGRCGKVCGEGAEVSGDGFDGVGIGLGVAGEEAGHLGAGFAVLRAADESPEGIHVESGTDVGEVGAWFGADELGPGFWDGVARRAVEFGEENQASLGEEGVVVFGEVKLVEGVNVRMIERWGFEGVCVDRTGDQGEQCQRDADRKSAANGG